MPTKFVCLANSFKEGGRCLAGIELDTNSNPVFFEGRPKWIRPVCNTPHGEVPNHFAQSFQVLDIIEIITTGVKPEGYQSENVTFNISSLKKIGTFERTQLQTVCENNKFIFATRYDSLPEDLVLKLNHSLLLIKPTTFKLIEKPNEKYPDKPKQRLQFSFNDFTYNLSITDLAFLRKYQKNPDFFSDVNEIFLCISLGIKFPVTNRFYKLVAGIIY